jgi:hypothetical protein
MAFPDISTLSPQDGAIHIIGENKFVFSSSTGKWEKATLNPTARFDPPAVPYNGQLWFDTDTTGRLYMWNEGATSWIQLTGHQLDGGGNATVGYVDTAIANLIDSSPNTLNTLNEIAAAIGDDPNFGTSISTSIAGKLDATDFVSNANSWFSGKALNTLADVSSITPLTGQVLKYAGGYWQAETLASPQSLGAVMSGDVDASGFAFVIDENEMGSNSATKIPTQQSVKSYVDSVITTVASISLSSISGNLDNISDGTVYKRSQNNFSHSLKSKLEGIPASDAQTQGAVMEYDFSTASMGFVINEDNMSSNLDTKIPTQQSVKAYVDSLRAYVDTREVVMEHDFSTTNMAFVINEDDMSSNLDTKIPTQQSVKAYVDGRESAIIGTSIPTLAVTKTSAVGSAVIPKGTTAQRDSVPEAGLFRWNTELSNAEIYDGIEWGLVGGGNTTEQVLWEHGQSISENYQIISGNNAVTAGTITINTNSSVEIPSGTTWALV